MDKDLAIVLTNLHDFLTKIGANSELHDVVNIAGYITHLIITQRTVRFAILLLMLIFVYLIMQLFN